MVNLLSTPNGEYLCDTSPAADFGGKQFFRATGCGIAADKRRANIEAAALKETQHVKRDLAATMICSGAQPGKPDHGPRQKLGYTPPATNNTSCSTVATVKAGRHFLPQLNG